MVTQVKGSVLPIDIITPEMFGAVGDGVSDDSGAFIAMLNSFPSEDTLNIYLSEKTYKIDSTAFYITRSIKMFGAGRDKTVLDFSTCTDVVNTPYLSHIVCVHPGNLYDASTNPDGIQLPVGWVGDYGFKAQLNDFQVSCNSSVTNGTGIFINCPIYGERVRVVDANLHNIAVIANATRTDNVAGTGGLTGLAIGGNANLTNLVEWEGRNAVVGEGCIVRGSDANACYFEKMDCRNNKGYGVADDSLLGNTHVQPHTSGNLQGGYWSTSSKPSYSTFVSAYAEGGQGADNGGLNTSFGNRALILNPQGDIEHDGSGILRKLASFLLVDDLLRVGTGINGDAPRTDIDKGSITVDRSDAGQGDISIGRVTSSYLGIEYSGENSILFHTGGGTGALSTGVPWLSKGMGLSPSHRQTAETAAPTTGDYVQGEFVWNENPSVDGNNMILLGWSCVTSGTPGTWQPCYVSTVSPAT